MSRTPRSSPPTHPAVDLELLVQHGLLEGRRLRARSGGRKAPRGLLQHARAGCEDGLHGVRGVFWLSAGVVGSALGKGVDTEGERRRGEGREDECQLIVRPLAAPGPPATPPPPGSFGRISPTQSRACDFRSPPSPTDAPAGAEPFTPCSCPSASPSTRRASVCTPSALASAGVVCADAWDYIHTINVL